MTATLALAGCSGSGRPPAPAAQDVPTEPVVDAPAAVAPTPAGTLGRPVPLKPLAARRQADVLVTVPPGTPLPAVTSLAPAGGAVVYRAGTVVLAGRAVRAVGVDPATFRAFTAKGTAESTAVWQSVARGDAVVSHALAKSLRLPLGGNVDAAAKAGSAPLPLRVGALATTGIPMTDLVVDDATATRLGLPAPNAALLTAAQGTDAVALAGKVRKLAGGVGEVDLLTAPAANPVAFLSGSRAAKAFGAFSYRYFPDGTIQPDAEWVRTSIQSTTVPIFGRVTCHRLMLPQLRGALEEVVAAGLAGSLKTYDGCYVPRFIERNPENSISLHTWGIAIDLDAATNYRGIRGTMDPRVVTIFKRWGFRWGGDWAYTDPMHFELGALRG